MKTLKYFLFFSLFVFAFGSVKAQEQFSGWLASFNTFRLDNKFSIHFDGQLRSTDKLQQVQTILLRPGLNYHLNKTWIFTAGYAYISNRRTVSNISDLLPEHRIWQQALASHKIKNISVSHRFRFEERFISKAAISNNELSPNGNEQAFRFRYFLRSMFPFSKQTIFTRGLFFALQNEVFLNTGDKSVVNGKIVDQNRLYGAIGFRLPGKMDAEAGYMHQYTTTRTSFISNHIAQIAIYKRL